MLISGEQTMIKSTFIVALYVCSLVAIVSAEKPKQLSSCKAQLNNGDIIDLSSLDKASNPRIATKGDYNYLFNPCSPISCVKELPTTEAVCQKSYDNKYAYNCGSQSTVVFTDFSNDVLTIQYTAPDKVRSSTIQCTCAKSEAFTILDDSSVKYKFNFASKCCCPGSRGCAGGGGGGGGESSGLSFGSVLLIIFFPGLAAYFIIGALYLKFVKHNNGAELIPNRGFWTSLPGDVKDGFTFAKSKVASRAYSQV